MTTAVEAPTGHYVGLPPKDGICEFRGIRYATAGRFAEPVQQVAHQGTVVADTFGGIAYQVPGFLELSQGMSVDDMSEDCHFLNIFVPDDATPESKLPVLFWVHGGGFVNGSGSAEWYSGGNLARRAAVVVTINYRLGAFGYLGDRNLGLLDQVCALRWVRDNIVAFGGNPGNVTVFGESAGGSATVSLIASPMTTGLIHRAWAMSPSIGQYRDSETAGVIEQMFLEELGVASLVKAMDVPATEILDAQTRVSARRIGASDNFAPTHGGAGLLGHIVETASLSPVPLAMGSNRDESRLWTAFDPAFAAKTEADWTKHLDRIFGSAAGTARAVYEELRPGESYGQLITAVNSDVAFRQHVRELANRRDAVSNPTWVYWFTWASTALGGQLGSCHALDIPFAFDNLDAPKVRGLIGHDADTGTLATEFADHILHFAVHGHAAWAQYDRKNGATLRMDLRSELLSHPENEIHSLFGN
ncbi:MAG: hypothetical protein RLZZ526_12 [Actinomycetota bacterium]|jgi:para-nitrobenzyl esterase